MKYVPRWLIGVLVGLIGLAVLVDIVRIVSSHTRSSMSMGSSTGSTHAVATDMVTISDFSFAPQVITVKAGAAVMWMNQDDVSHTITADHSSADAPASAKFGRGQTYQFHFTKAGTYTYHCTPHPYMHGTVIVTN